MDELDKDEEEDADESGFGHDPVLPKKGKSKGAIILPDDDLLDTDEPGLVDDNPDEESLDKLADDEDVEDSFDDDDIDQW
jgi:hypothetical protein